MLSLNVNSEGPYLTDHIDLSRTFHIRCKAMTPTSWVFSQASISSETAARSDQWSVSTLHWPHRSVCWTWQLCPNRYPLLPVIAWVLLAFPRHFTDGTSPHRPTTTISQAPGRDTIALDINTLGITSATLSPWALSDQPSKSGKPIDRISPIHSHTHRDTKRQAGLHSLVRTGSFS